jgi:hypothetical protein
VPRYTQGALQKPFTDDVFLATVDDLLQSLVGAESSRGA